MERWPSVPSQFLQVVVFLLVDAVLPHPWWVFLVSTPLTADHLAVGPLADHRMATDFIEWNRQNFRWIRQEILVVFGS